MRWASLPASADALLIHGVAEPAIPALAAVRLKQSQGITLVLCESSKRCESISTDLAFFPPAAVFHYLPGTADLTTDDPRLFEANFVATR